MIRRLNIPVVHFLLILIGASIAQNAAPLTLGIPTFRVAMIIGLVLLALASALAGAAILQMWRHRTTIEPGGRPTTLMTSGLFARSRNPIYVALIILLGAIGVMADSVWIASGAVLLWAVLDIVIVRQEEVVLEDLFGERYLQYKSRVRRWI